jgi:hypothetical protein
MIQTRRTIFAEILPFIGSDHWSILLPWESNLIPQPKILCFRRFWMEHLKFMQNTATQWHHSKIMQNIATQWHKRTDPVGTQMYRFQHNSKHVKFRIKNWNKKIFGNIFEAKMVLEKEMTQREIIMDQRYKKKRFCGRKNIEWNGQEKDIRIQSSSTTLSSIGETKI